MSGSSGQRGQDDADTRRRQALERRRLLLKGLGKGGAVVAAATPLQTLAGGRVLTSDGHVCSVSGGMSAARSVTSGNPTCGGHGHTKWCTRTNWPDYQMSYNDYGQFTANCPTKGSKTIHSNTGSCYFNTTFGAGTAHSFWTILNGTYGTDDERAWICALLNARQCKMKNAAMNFPYTPEQVIELYPSANALNFFKTYLMQMP